MPDVAAPVAPRSPERARVLLADDDPVIRRTLSRLLAASGYEVETADDVGTAVAAARARPCDVVVSDIMFPGGTGLDLLREVRALDPDVPVVLLTGTPRIETAVQAVEFGALRYLTKPIEPEVLAATMTDAWRLRRMARLRREAVALFGAPEQLLGDRDALDRSFRAGIENIWMAFQPIVRAGSGDVFGYEALLRTREPSIPHPGVFLAAAEKLTRLQELGRAARSASATGAAELPCGASVFVNLHAQDLLDDQLFDERSPLTSIASRVVLEITERVSLDHLRDASARIGRLRALGFRIAIDDLGAGYAGLTSFAHLAPDIVKFDMSLIRNVHRDPMKSRLIGSIAHLCREMGIQVVAEGVETAEEQQTLVDLGCDLLQGYLFGKPAPPPAAVRA